MGAAWTNQVYVIGAYTVFNALSDPMTSSSTAVAGQYASYNSSGANWMLANATASKTALLCFKQTYSTTSTCSTSNGFSISLSVSLGAIPTLDSSIADAFVMSFLSPSVLSPTTCTFPATQNLGGVTLPLLAGFHLVVDLYNNADGVGFKAITTTSTTATVVSSNIATGSAGVSLLTANAVTAAYVTHTIDVFNGFITWRIGGAVVLSGVSASLVPAQFFLAFMASTGGTVSSQYLSGPLTFGCTAFPSPPPPPSPPSPPPSPPPPLYSFMPVTAGLTSWYDTTSVFPSSNVWADKSGYGRNGTMVSVGALQNQTAGTGGSSCAFSTVTGATTSRVTFGISITAFPFSVCGVSRYMPGSNQRIFTSVTPGTNSLYGHLTGNAGIVYLTGFATSNAAGNVAGLATDWVVTCVSAASASSVVVYINGVDRTVAGTGFLAPQQIGINTYVPSTVYAEQSTFAATELLTWNVSLSTSQLWQVSSYLSTRYCLTLSTAPPPPTPPPSPPPPQCATTVTLAPGGLAITTGTALVLGPMADARSVNITSAQMAGQWVTTTTNAPFVQTTAAPTAPLTNTAASASWLAWTMEGYCKMVSINVFVTNNIGYICACQRSGRRALCARADLRAMSIPPPQTPCRRATALVPARRRR